ncbi:phage tail tube protein [Salmonella enterica subsp. enterica serovar Poona]|nr:phage tail tube protein [Salmonella enterica subsp. enterica serovar Poona]ELM0493077.1 phage tail tube protein [Salmonella enterica]
MADSSQLMGRALIRANGQELPSLDGATMTPSSDAREVLKGYRVLGFQVSPQEAHLECKIQQTPGGVSVDDINAMDNVTVTFEADTGETWTIANAWSDGKSSLTDKGEIAANFYGKKSQRTA